MNNRQSYHERKKERKKKHIEGIVTDLQEFQKNCERISEHSKRISMESQGIFDKKIVQESTRVSDSPEKLGGGKES